MRNFNEDTITDAVIDRIKDAPDARIKEISASLVRHLHDFVRDVRLTEAEWAYAIDFLTRTGKTCDGNRQEFILLSDTLGISMLVDAINHGSSGVTETTVLGPFYVENPPAANGVYRFWSIKPAAYPIPYDGPVGNMLTAQARHPWRPAHVHFMIEAADHEKLTIHVFVNGDQYLDSDAVFGVKDSLIADFVHHEAGKAPDGRVLEVPFFTLDYDFVLRKGT